MSKVKIELIPLTDNLMLCIGSVIKCLQEIDFDARKIRHIENRMLGTLQAYPLTKSINILSVFEKILEGEGIELVNAITHRKGFYVADIKLYKNEIAKIEAGLNK